MICIAKPGLVYTVKGRICNDMIYVLYAHLTKASIFIRHTPIFSSEGMLHKDCDSKGSVAKRKNQDWS
jgi:hypothetical protein